jgi:hypothetical protein
VRSAIPLLALVVALPTLASADELKEQCIQANADAQTLRRESRLVKAREKLLFCADRRCPRMVRDDCAQRLDEVERAQPSVIFDVHDGAGGDVAQAQILLDGAVLVSRIDGAAVPVDPGEHVFVCKAAGQPDVPQRLVIKEEEKGRHVTFVVGPKAVAGSLPETPPPEEPHPATSTGATQRGFAWAAAGLGVAGLATGGVFAYLAAAAKTDYLKHCGSNIGAPAGQCDSTGVDGHHDAVNKALIANIGFAVGGAAGVAAIVLFVTAPHSPSSPRVGFGPGEVFVRGEF